MKASPPARAAAASAPRPADRSGTGPVRARVTVYPRREILDPQGKAIRNALAGIGFDQVEDVRAGKSFEVTLGARTRTRAEELLTSMCQRLLANPVVEDYAVELLDGETAPGEPAA